MASSSEIEKLERRCAENPHGLTFAPLAEAYRKHGDLDRALEVLRGGRELHPDYIPASIVLGRCHIDRGDLPDAERAFAHVLTLDPENVIALKALADLAEREGRTVQAERWLNLLLAVDPSNEEARAQHERIRGGSVEAPASEPGIAEAVVIEVTEGEPVGAAEHSAAPVTPGPDTDHVVMSAHGSPGDAPAEDEPLQLDHTAAGRHDLYPRDDLGAPEELEPAEPVEPVPAFEPADDLEQLRHAEPAERVEIDVLVERAEEIVLTPASESDYRPETGGTLPEYGQETADQEPEPEPEQATDDDAARYSDAAASSLEPLPDLMAGFSDPRDRFDEADEDYPAGLPEPAPVVTESMAELCLRQGHRNEALAIYRQLAERRPDDQRLAERVAELTADLERASAAAPSRPSFAAAETGGRSVSELLRAVLSGRLPAAPPAAERFPENGAVAEFRAPEEVLSDAEDDGEPTRPADDHLTLGAVFGDEGAAAPPAVASEAPAGERRDDGLSFDEFFGSPRAAEPDATRTSPPAPSGDPDDLDQFHAWLQSLKR